MAMKIQNSKSFQQMNNITSKGVEEINNKIIKDIPLNLIDPNPDNTTIFSLNYIENLMEAIEESGFMGAIEVFAKEDGRYQISSGHRRYEAMSKLGKKTIPCIVYKMEDPITVKKMLVESNINIRVLSPLELSRSILYYEKALNESGYSGDINKKLASVFNISESKVHKLKRVNYFIDDITDMATSLTFPYEAFYDAVNFTKEQQEQLVTLIKNHMQQFPDAEISKTLVKQFIQQIKNEIKLEKERKERERILQEARIIAEKEAAEREAAERAAAEANKVTQENLSYENIKQDKPIIVPSAENQSYFSNIVDYRSENSSVSQPNTNNEIVTLSYENSDIVEPISKGNNNIHEKIVDVDFDLQLYTSKLKNIIEAPDIKMSAEARKSTIELLTDILQKLKNME